MKVYFVGAGPGDPELLTVKARRLLADARLCIYAGSLINPVLLDLLPAKAERYDSAAMNLEEIVAHFQSAHERQIDVVRLHTGEPSIYGAIGEQMDALDRLGIAYEMVPGISAFQAAAAALRVELTAPDVAQTIILTRTPGRTPMPPAEDLSRLAQSRATLCIFLSTDRIAELATMLTGITGPIARLRWCFMRLGPTRRSSAARSTILANASRPKESPERPFFSWASPWNAPCPMPPSFTTRHLTTVTEKNNDRLRYFFSSLRGLATPLGGLASLLGCGISAARSSISLALNRAARVC